MIGDGGEDPDRRRTHDEARGKILRLNPNGSIPASNPFGTRSGLRPSQLDRVRVRSASGDLWETENGPDCNDEINLIAGRELCMGAVRGVRQPRRAAGHEPGRPPPPNPPAVAFAQTIAISGSGLLRPVRIGALYEGDLLFGCANGTCKTTVGPIGHVGLVTDRARPGRPSGEGPDRLRRAHVLDGGRAERSDLRQ